MNISRRRNREYKKIPSGKIQGGDLKYGDFFIARYQELGKQAISFANLLGQAALAYCVAIGVAMTLLVSIGVKLTEKGSPVTDFSTIIDNYPLIMPIALGLLFINLLYLSLLVGYGYVLGANRLKMAIMGVSLPIPLSFRKAMSLEPTSLSRWGAFYSLIAICGGAIFPFVISFFTLEVLREYFTSIESPPFAYIVCSIILAVLHLALLAAMIVGICHLKKNYKTLLLILNESGTKMGTGKQDGHKNQGKLQGKDEINTELHQ